MLYRTETKFFFFSFYFHCLFACFLIIQTDNFEELFHCWIVKSFASETTIIYLSSGSNVELFMRRTKCKLVQTMTWLIILHWVRHKRSSTGSLKLLSDKWEHLLCGTTRVIAMFYKRNATLSHVFKLENDTNIWKVACLYYWTPYAQQDGHGNGCYMKQRSYLKNWKNAREYLKYS